MNGSSPDRTLQYHSVSSFTLVDHSSTWGKSLRTVSGVDLRCCALRVAEHDGNGWVVLLHRRVGAREERPARVLESANGLVKLRARLRAAVRFSKWEEAVEGIPSHLVAALCSDVWQKRNRTSLRALANAYLPDMLSSSCRQGDRGVWLFNWVVE